MLELVSNRLSRNVVIQTIQKEFTVCRKTVIRDLKAVFRERGHELAKDPLSEYAILLEQAQALNMELKMNSKATYREIRDFMLLNLQIIQSISDCARSTTHGKSNDIQSKLSELFSTLPDPENEGDATEP